VLSSSIFCNFISKRTSVTLCMKMREHLCRCLEYDSLHVDCIFNTYCAQTVKDFVINPTRTMMLCRHYIPFVSISHQFYSDTQEDYRTMTMIFRTIPKATEVIHYFIHYLLFYLTTICRHFLSIRLT